MFITILPFDGDRSSRVLLEMKFRSPMVIPIGPPGITVSTRLR